jgi:cold shock CspA family protein
MRPEKFKGQITATVAMDKEEWKARGALFATLDDGDGERVRLAAAMLDTKLGELEFGVLDYGEGTTYLLLADPALVEGPDPTSVLLKTLTERGLLAPELILDERSAHEAETSLAARVAVLERRLETLGTPENPPDPLPEPRRQRHTGVVKWLDKEKGYGFIRPDDGSEDVYFHHSAVIDKGSTTSPAGDADVRSGPEVEKDPESLAKSPRSESQ